jgi:hypothetical protein
MAIASGTKVESGYYWNSKSWGFAHVGVDGAAIGGDASARWVKVPTPVVLAAAPVLGGIFVVALPFLGFAALARAASRRLTGGVKEGAAEIAASLGPVAAPGEAHLTGKPGEADAPAAGTAPELEKLEEDVAARRRK